MFEWARGRLQGTLLQRVWRRLRGRSVSLAEVNDAYDRQTVEVMRRILRADSNCVDVGAHTGDILQYMVELAPAGRHHAVEALPHLAAQLRKRFPNVKVHEVAASTSAGTSDFQFVVNAPGYSGLRRRVYDRPDPRIQTIQVRVVPLDDEIPEDANIAFLKIDIEGGEYHAIQGATKLIRRCKPVIVFEAGIKSTGQYGVSPTELYRLVTQELGYDVSTMARWMSGAPSFTEQEFEHNWSHGPDYYFIATPARSAGA